MAFRKPSTDEARLLEFLGQAARSSLSPSWTDGLLVEEMSDGGLGSLRLRPSGVTSEDQVLHKTLAACQFKDADEIEVIVSLYANKSGVPFELDVWKVDFSPLARIPEKFQLLDESDIPAKRGS